LVAILKQKDIEIVGEAADGEQTCKLNHEFSPDFLMVDLRIPRKMVCKLSLT
jgi:YesN/AraC family two-component response regulator